MHNRFNYGNGNRNWILNKLIDLGVRAQRFLPKKYFETVEVRPLLETRKSFFVENKAGFQTWIQKNNIRKIDSAGDTMKIVLPHTLYKEWFN